MRIKADNKRKKQVTTEYTSHCGRGTKSGEEQLFNIPGDRLPSPIMATLQVNQAEIQMEVDTGASVSIISSDTYTKLWPATKRPLLQPSNRKLRTYTAEQLVVEGELTVDVRY